LRGIRYRMRWRHGKLVSNICYYKFVPKFWVLLLGERIWRRDGSLPRYFDDYFDPDWVMRLWVSTAKFPFTEITALFIPQIVQPREGIKFFYSLSSTVPERFLQETTTNAANILYAAPLFILSNKCSVIFLHHAPNILLFSKCLARLVYRETCASQNRCISTRAKCSPANWPYAISFCDILSTRIRFSPQSESANPISLTS
jgi:hypothetical protein